MKKGGKKEQESNNAKTLHFFFSTSQDFFSARNPYLDLDLLRLPGRSCSLLTVSSPCEQWFLHEQDVGDHQQNHSHNCGHRTGYQHPISSRHRKQPFLSDLDQHIYRLLIDSRQSIRNWHTTVNTPERKNTSHDWWR